MAAATSNSLNDLATAFLIQALGLNPLLSPVLNAAGLPPSIGVSPDQVISGPAGGITAVNANLATGIATAGSTVAFPNLLSGMASLAIQVQGAFVGTLVVQVSNDNINWTSLASAEVTNLASAGQANITGPGVYLANTSGFSYVRVTCSAYTSGTPTVFLKISGTSSALIVAGSLPTGSASLGQVGVFATNSGAAATIAKILTAATTNATSVKATSGKLYSILLTNNTAAGKFFHFHNKASAPVVGTDSPTFTLAVPPNFGTITIHSDIGLNFNIGIAYSVTAGPGDTDATATAVNDVSGALGYI